MYRCVYKLLLVFLFNLYGFVTKSPRLDLKILITWGMLQCTPPIWDFVTLNLSFVTPNMRFCGSKYDMTYGMHPIRMDGRDCAMYDVWGFVPPLTIGYMRFCGSKYEIFWHQIWDFVAPNMRFCDSKYEIFRLKIWDFVAPNMRFSGNIWDFVAPNMRSAQVRTHCSKSAHTVAKSAWIQYEIV